MAIFLLLNWILHVCFYNYMKTTFLKHHYGSENVIQRHNLVWRILTYGFYFTLYLLSCSSMKLIYNLQNVISSEMANNTELYIYSVYFLFNYCTFKSNITKGKIPHFSLLCLRVLFTDSLSLSLVCKKKTLLTWHSKAYEWFIPFQSCCITKLKFFLY